MNVVTFDSPLTVETRDKPACGHRKNGSACLLLWQQKILSLPPYLVTKASRMETKCYPCKFPVTMLRYLHMPDTVLG